MRARNALKLNQALEVERSLVRHYLHSDGPLGAAACRYIDASTTALRVALNCAEGVDPVLYLADACGADETAMVLSNGWSDDWTDKHSPGFFRFLILTCAVVSTQEVGRSSREFGATLARTLNTNQGYGNRTALPKLWIRLQLWVAFRRAKGESLRELALPSLPPSHMRYLQITYSISFPTWRDLSHLRTVLERRPELLQVETPFEAARRICPVVRDSEGFSPAMKLANAEFSALYRARASMLILHRYWAPLAMVLGENRCEKTSLPMLEATLNFTPDADEVELELQIVRSGAIARSGSEGLSGNVDDVMARMDLWLGRQEYSISRSSVATLMRSGRVPFTEEGFGRWVATGAYPSPPRRCVLLVRAPCPDGQFRLGPIKAVGESWCLAGPFSTQQMAEVFATLNLVPPSSFDLSSADVRVVGGIRNGPRMLGRIRVLPHIEITGRGDLSISERDSRQGLGLQLVNGRWQIVTSEALDGKLHFRLEEAPLEGIDPLILEKSVHFSRDADEHVELKQPEDEAWSHVDECVTTHGSPVYMEEASVSQESASLESSAAFDDLLEAIYAGGRSGWPEQELLALVRHVLGSDGPSPWHVLRSLQESGWLAARVNVRWRARRWWLVEPTLLEVRHDGDISILLRGSASAIVRRRFSDTVRALGGTVVNRLGVGPYSPLSISAKGVEIGVLGLELRWLRSGTPKVLRALTGTQTAEDGSEPSRHRLASTWSWRTRRFEVGSGDGHEVQLTRHRRDRGDRADLYVVTSNRIPGAWCSASRTLAVLEAHRRAAMPMFEVADGRLLSLGDECYLPLSIAALCNIQATRNCGPVRLGDVWRYAYPLHPAAVAFIEAALGKFAVRTLTSKGQLASSPSCSSLVGWQRKRGRFASGILRRGTI